MITMPSLCDPTDRGHLVVTYAGGTGRVAAFRLCERCYRHLFDGAPDPNADYSVIHWFDTGDVAPLVRRGLVLILPPEATAAYPLAPTRACGYRPPVRGCSTRNGSTWRHLPPPRRLRAE